MIDDKVSFYFKLFIINPVTSEAWALSPKPKFDGKFKLSQFGLIFEDFKPKLTLEDWIDGNKGINSKL